MAEQSESNNQNDVRAAFGVAQTAGDFAGKITSDDHNAQQQYIDEKTNLKELGIVDPEQLNVVPQDFDPTQIKKDALVMVVGKRRFGKSIFTQWCLSYLWPYYADGAYVFTTTKHNWFWQQHVPDTRIYPGPDFEVINQILDQQKEKFEDRKKTGQKHLGNIVMIFDDCISERKDSRYSEDMLRLAFNGRHYGVSVWLLTQDIKGYFPDIRANSDYACLTYQIQTRQTKTIREDFADFFPDRETFGNMLRKYTQDFQLLVIDQSSAKYDYTEDTFYVAKPIEFPEPYKIGDADFWKESGCDWKEQLEIWQNIQNSKLEDADYDELAQQRAKYSEENEERIKQERDEYRTPAYDAARGDKKIDLQKQLHEKYFGNTNTGTKNWDEFENHLNNMFIPTKKGYIKHKPFKFR